MGTGSELLLEDQALSSGCAGFEGSVCNMPLRHHHRKVEEAVDTSLGFWERRPCPVFAVARLDRVTEDQVWTERPSPGAP